MHAYGERRFLAAGLAGACSAFSYSSGAFLAAVFGLHLLLVERQKPWRVQVLQWLLTSGVTALGFAAFLLLLQVETGTWQAYFLVQAKYAYAPTWPWVAITNHVSAAYLDRNNFVSMQTALVALLAVTVLVGAARAPRSVRDGALAMFLFIYWWVPLALGGSLSLYRAEAMLLPSVVLAQKLKAPLILIFVLLALFVAAKMDVLFFRNTLV